MALSHEEEHAVLGNRFDREPRRVPLGASRVGDCELELACCTADDGRSGIDRDEVPFYRVCAAAIEQLIDGILPGAARP
jgi:hypothetical protein